MPTWEEKVSGFRDGCVGEHESEDRERFGLDLRVGESFDASGEVSLWVWQGEFFFGFIKEGEYRIDLR